MKSTDNDRIDSACFICDGPPDLSVEQPGCWLVPRSICREHRALARLPNKEFISEFLDRRIGDDYPMEGSGLNYIINPVQINNLRAWLDFHFAMPAILEEIFPSNSYFEYAIQHRSDLIDVMYFMHSHRSSSIQILSLFDDKFDSFPAVYNMISMWGIQKNITATCNSSQKIFPASPEEAEVLANNALNNLNAEQDLDSFVSTVLQLAESRFSHL